MSVRVGGDRVSPPFPVLADLYDEGFMVRVGKDRTEDVLDDWLKWAIDVTVELPPSDPQAPAAEH
ncbi:hypothetical protein QEZ40_007426 [Streptomyces katrae]|uniref:Uncharacterized protein n=1 Tax=Streptomyces katrae TaxID=68223 RepID=A0ABT7GQS0_9ACTN|nr:hypothetical protein [Streptomyces katrae]MDK9495938.1 hypothetical protein [Streptomyces katrae]